MLVGQDGVRGDCRRRPGMSVFCRRLLSDQNLPGEGGVSPSWPVHPVDSRRFRSARTSSTRIPSSASSRWSQMWSADLVTARIRHPGAVSHYPFSLRFIPNGCDGSPAGRSQGRPNRNQPAPAQAPGRRRPAAQRLAEKHPCRNAQTEKGWAPIERAIDSPRVGACRAGRTGWLTVIAGTGSARVPGR